MSENRKIETANTGLNIEKYGVVIKDSKVVQILFDAQSSNNDVISNVFLETKRQIDEYFQGLRKNFELPYTLSGSLFELSVLKEIINVPYGETISYARLANSSGYPKAVRAVATVCRKNKLPILIPCHRVIKSDGTPGKYSGGDLLKIALLELEKKYK